MAIPLTSESAPAPTALIDGGVVASGPGRKGMRTQYRCTVCGYGIVVYGQPPSCPMCSEARWEHVEWRPFSQLARQRARARGRAGRDRGGVKSLIQAPAGGEGEGQMSLTQAMTVR